MVMSINISLSESGPINLDDILKDVGAFRNEGASSSVGHVDVDSALISMQKPIGSARRKTGLASEEQRESSDDDQPYQPQEEKRNIFEAALEARTLRTIAESSTVNTDIVNGDTRKRHSYTLLFKRECVRRLRHGGISMNQMSRETGIDRRCLRSWLKQEAQLQEESQVECTRKRMSGGGRKASYIQLENKLNEWYQAETVSGRDVTYRKLNIAAYRLAKEYGMPNAVNYSKKFLIAWQKKNHLIFKPKSAHDDIISSSAPSAFHLSNDDPEPKSLMDLLFEGIEGQFVEGMEPEACESSDSVDLLSSQHSATVFTRSNELMAETEIGDPPLLCAHEEGDGCGSETPPHLDMEGNDVGSMNAHSPGVHHSYHSQGVQTTDFSSSISEERCHEACTQTVTIPNQMYSSV
uniref:HTH CENPB-type domain-containing protein n=1 Tax=Parascaris univalens TaxID=6257 RepID=A0A915ACW6_PARUN